MDCFNKDVWAFDRKHNDDCQQVKLIAKSLYTSKKSLEKMFLNLKLLGKEYYFPKIQDALFGVQKDEQKARYFTAHFFSVILYFIDYINFLHHGQMISKETIAAGKNYIHPSIHFHFNEISYLPEDNEILLSMMCLDFYYVKLNSTRNLYDADYSKTMKNLRVDPQYPSNESKMTVLKAMRKNYIIQNESMEFKQEEIYELGGMLSYWNTMGKNMIVMLQNSVGFLGNCNTVRQRESIHSDCFGDLNRNDSIVANSLGDGWNDTQYQISCAPAFMVRGGLKWTGSHLGDKSSLPHLLSPTLEQLDAVIDMDVQLLKTTPRRRKPSAPGETGWSMRIYWARLGFLPDQGGVDGCEPEHYDDLEMEEVKEEQEYKRARMSV